MISLQEFYENKELKNNIYEYLIEFCKVQAIEKTFNREPTEHIAEAKEVIDKAFENLDTLFAKTQINKQIINEAR